jgi:3-oxoadipate enol-lactonase
VAFRVDGPAGQPWLVLAHSLAASHRMWDPQVEALAQGHRVLRYDLAGHGDSEPAEGEGSLESFAATALGLMDALAIDRAGFLGLSIGGAIGVATALAAPARISRLVACCCRVDAPPPYVEAWRQRAAAVHEGGLAAVVEPTLERWFSAGFRAGPAAAALLDSAREMILGTSVAGYVHGAGALQRGALADRLSTLAMPVLYVAGAGDTAVPPGVMAALQAATPGSRLEVLDGAHLCNLERPDLFTPVVAEWFDPRHA